MSRLTGEYSQHLLYGVLGLLVLSLLAPLAWHHGRPLAMRGPSEPVLAAPEPLPWDHPVALPSVAIAQDERMEPGSVQPVVAQIGPLVAENIDLDPSITETPALPAQSPAPLPDPSSSGSGLPSLPLNSASAPLDPSPATPEPELPGAVIQRLPPAPAELAASKAWAYPAGLIEQLNLLAATLPEAANWSARTKAEAEHLAHIEWLGCAGRGPVDWPAEPVDPKRPARSPPRCRPTRPAR